LPPRLTLRLDESINSSIYTSFSLSTLFDWRDSQAGKSAVHPRNFSLTSCLDLTQLDYNSQDGGPREWLRARHDHQAGGENNTPSLLSEVEKSDSVDSRSNCTVGYISAFHLPVFPCSRSPLTR
jgi:hypothetical protein